MKKASKSQRHNPLLFMQTSEETGRMWWKGTGQKGWELWGSREELPTELECSAQALALSVITSVQGRKRALSCSVHHKGDAEVGLVQLFWK